MPFPNPGKSVHKSHFSVMEWCVLHNLHQLFHHHSKDKSLVTADSVKRFW